MLTLLFMFILFNLTSIWNLPSFSTGERGRDSVLSLIGPRAHSLSTVTLGKHPHEASPDEGIHP